MKRGKTFSTLKINNEDGFTLIEILVVILVIGILSAVAVPVFLNQRQKSNDAVVESDVKSMAVAIETYYTNNREATNIDRTEVMNMFKKTDGVVLNYTGDRNDWCLSGAHTNGYIYRNWNNNPLPGVRPYVLYTSKNGGFHPTAYMSGLSCYFGVTSL